MPGIELSATLQYQGDITQGEDTTAGAATLFETPCGDPERRIGITRIVRTVES